MRTASLLSAPLALHQCGHSRLPALRQALAIGSPAGLVPVPRMPTESSVIPAGAVTIIPIHGPIMPVPAEWEDYGVCSLERLRDDVIAAQSRGGLVIFDIDSPGGITTGSLELAHRMQELALTSDVVAYVQQSALSLGYFFASACDLILASPSALLGSVGVIIENLSDSQYWEQQGYKPETFTSEGAELKKIGTFAHSFTESDRSFLQERVQKEADKLVGFIHSRRGPLPGGLYGPADTITTAQANWCDAWELVDGFPIDELSVAVEVALLLTSVK